MQEGQLVLDKNLNESLGMIEKVLIIKIQEVFRFH